MKREKKGISSIVVIIIVLVILIIIAGVILFVLSNKGESNDTTNNNNSNSQVIDINTNNNTISNNDINKNDNKNNKTTSGDVNLFVLKGYEIGIPMEYSFYINKDKGVIINDEDMNFTMTVMVSSAEYSDVANNPQKYSKDKMSGSNVLTKEMKEVTIDSKKYSYFVFKTADKDNNIVAYTEIEGGKCLALTAFYGDASKEQYTLEAFATIAKTAKKTTKPDTTEETLNQLKIPLDGTKRVNSEMKLGNYSITHSVPNNFYYLSTNSYTDTSIYESYKSTSSTDITRKDAVITIEVDCRLTSEGDPEATIRDSSQNVEGYSEVQAITVDGKTFSYVTLSRSVNGIARTEVQLVHKLSNGYYYTVQAVRMNAEPLTVEDVYDFLKITE